MQSSKAFADAGFFYTQPSCCYPVLCSALSVYGAMLIALVALLLDYLRAVGIYAALDLGEQGSFKRLFVVLHS